MKMKIYRKIKELIQEGSKRQLFEYLGIWKGKCKNEY